MESVSLEPFSVTVISKYVRKFTQSGSFYFAVKDGAEYSLVLNSNHGTKADAEVTIDGERIGTFRIPPYGSLEVERPADTARKLTFVKEASKRAQKAGVSAGEANNGLVQVEFKPEKALLVASAFRNTGKRVEPIDEDDISTWGVTEYKSDGRMTGAKGKRSRAPSPIVEVEEECANFRMFGDEDIPSNPSPANLSAGATILGKESKQQFRDVKPITDIDQSHARVIRFRLVVDDASPAVAEVSLARHYGHVAAMPVPPRIGA